MFICFQRNTPSKIKSARITKPNKKPKDPAPATPPYCPYIIPLYYILTEMPKDKVLKRCPWVGDDPLYIKYHDIEWSVPVKNDRKLFEFLVLESAQAGLSWITILRKRKNYRKAFAGFDPVKISKFTKRDVGRLMKNDGIIRNRLKIEATINNAKRFLEIQKEFGAFSKYIWSFVCDNPIKHKIKTIKDYKPTIREAEVLSADLKRRGFDLIDMGLAWNPDIQRSSTFRDFCAELREMFKEL